ncbi:CHAT domain-containing protein [Tenacibaculum xiamenense]|uniref:CHAT domain-containing protein n=1 Tax=Tenacibaculum xiamenense TaxID=1261553 RepID=UPI003895F11B
MSRFFLIFLCFSIKLYAQNSDQIRRIDSVFHSEESEKSKIEIVLDILKNEKSMSTSKAADVYHKLGLLENSIGDYEKAIEFTRKSVNLRRQSDSIAYYKLLNSLYNINYYYGKLNNEDKRKDIIKEIFSYSVENKFKYKALIDLAYLISEEGDYFRALEKFNEVVNSYNRYRDPKTLLKAHEGAIYAYSEIDKSEKYSEEIFKHITSIDTILKTHSSLNTSIGHDNNLANIYDGLKDYERAIVFYKKAEKICLHYQDSLGLSRIYNNLGRVHNVINEPTTADDYFVKALNFCNDKRSEAAVYNNQGDVMDTSIKLLNNKKAIETLLGYTYEEVPEFEAIKNSEYAIDILDYMIESVDAGTKLYTDTVNTRGIGKTLELVILVDKLISIVRQESVVDMSKLFWIEKASKFYMNGVTLAYHASNSSLAFYFMEKNKGLLLLEGLHKSKKEYFQEPTPEMLSSKIHEYIGNDTSFIEYILDEDEGYGLFYDDEGEIFFKLNNVPQLISDIQYLKKKVIQYFKTEKEKEEYTAIAKRVYETLFPFEKSFERIKNKKLIIVPDYLLQYINFETITPNSSDEYLVENIEILYFLSLSITDHLNKQNNNSKYGVFGIAPIDFKHSNLPSLDRSTLIMNKISNLYPSHMLIGKNAQTISFSKELEKYNIIHLNTHAGIDEIENEPWLMFHDKSLSFKEISELRNNADLVVLDVCNGAIGEHEVGEGVMSLARGFFRGGAKSVITSQWEANEKAVTEILSNFYEELSEGQTKSKALQMAKKKYLKNHQLSEKSPYYWGALVLTGNTEAVTLEIDYFRMIWVVLAMVSVFVCSKLIINHFQQKKEQN